MYYRAGVNSGPRTMWSATALSIARESIQEILQIWNILQLVTVNVSIEANLNWDLLQTTGYAAFSKLPPSQINCPLLLYSTGVPKLGYVYP